MRILFAGHRLDDPMGGGEISARTLLGRLAAFHEVEAIGADRVQAPAAMPYHLAAMHVETRFRPALARRVREWAPDLLILQSPAWLQPREIPGACKVILFMRSLACYGVGEANPSRWRQVIGRPFRAARLRRSRALIDRADLVVSNSRFLQHALLTRAGIASHVVPPFIDTAALSAHTNGGTGDHITFVGLDRWKGAAVALGLARSMPDRRFLFLAGARPSRDLVAQARRLPNVTCLEWTEDMAGVFQRTRILLMPSLWEEPFGRLPIEAGACGIPTIASARGGLLESVGEGGLLLDQPEDLDAWADLIKALDDPARYASLSAAARQHAARYRLAVTLRRLDDLLRSHLAIAAIPEGRVPDGPL